MGRQGRTGSTGSTGPQGPAGMPGPSGAPGAPGKSLLPPRIVDIITMNDFVFSVIFSRSWTHSVLLFQVHTHI